MSQSPPFGLGLQLPVQAPGRMFAEAWETHAGPAELLVAAKAADDAGFLYIGVCDHTVVPGRKAGRASAVWYEPFVTLAHLAAVTTRVRLLTHVLQAATRHPLHVAKAAATLDQLSGGRLILGVGAGYDESEFDALGVPFHKRGRLLDEAIDALRAALSPGPADHEGQHWSFAHVLVQPAPAQRRVPVWIGGASPAAMRRVVERGDGWLAQAADIPAQLAALKAIKERASALADPPPLALGAVSRAMYVGEPSWDVGPDTVTGPPERHAEVLSQLRDAGASHVQLVLRSRDASELADQIRLAGGELLPRLRDASPATP